MRPELRTEMLRILEDFTEGKSETLPLSLGSDSLTVSAALLLAEYGALDRRDPGDFRITILGYDYYEKLKSPKRYWVKNNWFPVGVLAVTLLAVIVNVIVELID